jgi:hypothetical protein
MRPWLSALVLILIPVALVCLKLLTEFRSIDSSLLGVRMPVLIVLLSTIAVFFLLRLIDRHSGNRHRH